jgi:hypothetical protein
MPMDRFLVSPPVFRGVRVAHPFHDMTEILLKVALNTINQPTNLKNTQDKGK